MLGSDLIQADERERTDMVAAHDARVRRRLEEKTREAEREADEVCPRLWKLPGRVFVWRLRHDGS